MTDSGSGRTTARLRVAPGVPLLRIRDPYGKFHDFYSHLHPPMLPEWALHDPEQVEHFLRLGMVELVDDTGKVADPGRAWECLSALIACRVPEDAGRPRAAQMLRESGLSYSNETISAAIRLRKSGAVFGEDQQP